MIVGYFINGMYGGYGQLSVAYIQQKFGSTANNLIMNVGRAVGGFSSFSLVF